ncbi:Gfo/Idh/MocA family oxidoreductase [Sphingobacterium sp. UT-1RO-CII-1]|uniref:Gfo/Idh/MocA family protein n=1 Tax=Sphingobacterium sp. UT-1RO-CII-1 TaxID=2995225 RepID=UPI00227A856D|nr:Gfo/Idh/MocA family oxidoreductase [Sphingobacterium sp. UT-1RO-CII-1]MCY4779630.1 Gfo/Idh/MocA family oxidoreductase [Sphingobacterium sp. UT-1RO-CII-1]
MINRRNFIKNSSLVLGAAAMSSGAMANTGDLNNRKIRVGLIGCGGRGTGAVFQALDADPGVVVTALADVFADNLGDTLSALKEKYGNRIEVTEKSSYVGFDAYEKLIKSDVDVVLLCTPPSFRPAHITLAVKEGKHVFCEKPVAVDIPGVHEVEAAVKLAKEKKLCIVSGFCFRYSFPNRDFVERIKSGSVGEIKAISTFRHGGELSYKDRKPEWNDVEYQLRNWVYQQRYSGDLIVEQTVHSIDYMSWILGDIVPTKVTATGGRQSRPWNKFGNVYDHFAVEYVYDNGFRGFHFGRQQNGTTSRNSVEVMGMEGYADVSINSSYDIFGKDPWKNTKRLNNMYQTQHDELFKAIREGKVLNDDFMTNSTLLAIWGRLSAYSGKTISHEEIINSTEKVGPAIEDYSWDMKLDEQPIARPGHYKFT